MRAILVPEDLLYHGRLHILRIRTIFRSLDPPKNASAVVGKNPDSSKSK